MMMIRLALVLLLLVPVSASALELYSAQVSQAALVPTPPALPQISTFTLQGAPTRFVIAINGVPVATLGKECGAPLLLDAASGWYLITCRLGALVAEGQVVQISADDKFQVYRVTYGEWKSWFGLIRMWGLQRL